MLYASSETYATGGTGRPNAAASMARVRSKFERSARGVSTTAGRGELSTAAAATRVFPMPGSWNSISPRQPGGQMPGTFR
jgi:hypothetical protein